MAIGSAIAGLLSFAYLWAISIHSVPWAIVLSLLMWGLVYQGYNAVFPSFYPELFPTRTRVSGVAIAQNIGTALTAMLPALFVLVAPPGASRIPLTIGAITFGITLIAALAALSTRETSRVPLQKLGDPAAQPVDERDYVRAREQAIADARGLKAAAP
jgi:MFS family permease